MPQVYTLCLSGPEKSRARAELALEEARVPLLPTDHHNYGWGAKVPLDKSDAVLVVEHPDVDHVVRALGARSKWVLRTHHHAHPKPEPQYDPIAELARRIAALEAQSPLPPIRGAAVESPAWAQQSGSFSAEQTRRAIFSAYARTAANSPGIINGGLLSGTDCQLTAPASGMSVNVSTGEVVIGGNEGGSQGGYYARVTSQTNLSISAANPSNPRIDLVCATVSDSGYTEPTGGSGNQWALQVITGTPTAGATLSNLLGVGTVPGSSLLLGYVLVPASATNIITADIANVAGVTTMQAAPRGTYVSLQAAASTDYSTTSTSWVAVDTSNYQATIPSRGVPLIVTVSGQFANISSNVTGIGVGLDGVPTSVGARTASTNYVNFAFTITFLPSAGSHTVTLYWFVVGGTGQIDRTVLSSANPSPVMVIAER